MDDTKPQSSRGLAIIEWLLLAVLIGTFVVLGFIPAWHKMNTDFPNYYIAAAIHRQGIPLDRALFPLLVSVERFGPIGVVELADRVGRDYTTVSRQVAKLESLSLVQRHASATDGRVREAAITAKGKAMTDRVDAARERIGRNVFESWAANDVDELTRLMRKFADALNDESLGAA